MEHVELWLVEMADRFPLDSGERRGVLIAASTWHEEGPAVLAQKEATEAEYLDPIAMFDGWVLVSDAIVQPCSLPPTGTLHHVCGCNQSNGNSLLRYARVDELASHHRCDKCSKMVV